MAQHPDRLHLAILEDDTTTLAIMSYREFPEAARDAAPGMMDHDVGSGLAIASP